MSDKEFEQLVAQAIRELPRRFREKMENVAVVVEDAPSPSQRKKGGVSFGSLLLGLYEGVPRTKRGPFYTLVLPDKITIFKSSIEAVAATPEEIIQQVKNTVWHEVAHHFGFSEERVRKLERKRKVKDA